MNTAYIENLKTPIAIIGLGKSGTSALALLREFGFKEAQLATYDAKESSATFNTVEKLLFFSPKTLVVSPGVPLNSSWIQTLVAGGVAITSEINLAASLLTTEKIIGVTGSVGKSTVVSLLGVGATSFDKNAFIGGNIGIPFCDYALEVLRGRPRANWVVLELSSFQLENCEKLSLSYSIVSFLSSNHLERYASLEDYYSKKLLITAITKELCLFNKSSKDCNIYAPRSKSEYKLVNAQNFSNYELLPRVFLIGPHNKDNFSLASEMGQICKWPESSLIEMTRYPGLPHRMEFVVEINGVTFINDSKATAMDSVLVAANGCLENISAEGRVYILLGGKDKNLPWEELAAFDGNEKILPVFFGACGELAQKKSGLAGERFEKLGSAINFCQKRSKPRDIVLLSPGGTSLDEFRNFEERGNFFKTIVLSALDA